MSRDIAAAVATAAAAENVVPVVLAALSFDSGVIRACSAPFNVTIDADGDGSAEIYFGVGDLGGVGQVQESRELRANNVTVELSGIPPELLSIALGEQYQGRPGRLWLLLFDANHRPIGSPCLVFKGRLDTMTIERGPTSRIQVSIESLLVDLERPRKRLYTDADQQAVFPGDRGLAFVAQMVDKSLTWGKVGQGGANQAG